MPARAAVEDGRVARQRLARGVAEVAQHGEVDVRVDVAERLDLEVARNSVDLLDAVEDRRHDHHRARRGGHAIELEPREPLRRHQRADGRCSSWIASSLSGTSASSATTTSAAPRQPCACAYATPRPAAGGRAHGHGAEIPGVAWRKKARGAALAGGRGPVDALLERPAPLADQVIADVRAAASGVSAPTCRARSTHFSASRSCASPVGSASSSTAWR
jgi:hypothetical protein